MATVRASLTGPICRLGSRYLSSSHRQLVTMRAHVRLLLLVLSLVLCPIVSGTAVAQVAAEKLSDIVFDIQPSEIRNGELFKQLNGDNLIQKWWTTTLPDSFIMPNNVDRIFGSVGLPQSIQQVSDWEDNGAAPFEFFLRIKFSDAQELSNVYDWAAKRSRIDALGGMEVLRPDIANVRKDFSLRKVDTRTLEIATDLYAVQKNRDFRTPALTAAWSKLPPADIRLAADTESARIAVDEAIKKIVPRRDEFLAGLYYPLENISGLGLSLDLENQEIVHADIDAKDAAGATALAQCLNTWLIVPKSHIQRFVEHTRVPRAKRISSELVDSFKFTQNGKQFELSVVKPDGFNEAVVRVSKEGR